MIENGLVSRINKNTKLRSPWLDCKQRLHITHPQGWQTLDISLQNQPFHVTRQPTSHPAHLPPGAARYSLLTLKSVLYNEKSLVNNNGSSRTPSPWHCDFYRALVPIRELTPPHFKV